MRAESDKEPIPSLRQDEIRPSPPWTAQIRGAWSRIDPSVAGPIAVLILLVLVSYGPVLWSLMGIWSARDDYSHGYLIPLISGYIIWIRRGAIRRLPVHPSVGGGLAVVTAAGAMLLIGRAGGIITINGLSLIVMLIGLVLLLLGRAHLKAMAFPILYLLFMVPVLDYFIAPIQWPSQLLTAKMSVSILQFLGYPVLLDRQYIVLPNIVLEVARVCSGVAYLVSILAIGLPLAALALHRWWSRTVLLLSAILIGVVVNWVRVVFIAAWAAAGHEVIHGPFHVFQGMLVSWVGFVGLFAGAWAISRLERGSDLRDTEIPAVEVSVDRPGIRRPWRWALGALCFLALYPLLVRPQPVPLKESLASFPYAIGDWIGRTNNPTTAPFRMNGADTELSRTYRNDHGESIDLYLAYWSTLRSDGRSGGLFGEKIHRQTKGYDLPLSSGGILPVRLGYDGDPPNRHRILFWYDLHGRAVADRYRAKILAGTQTLLGRPDGALVVLSRDGEGEHAGAPTPEEKAFVEALYPVLRRHLPGGAEGTP